MRSISSAPCEIFLLEPRLISCIVDHPIFKIGAHPKRCPPPGLNRGAALGRRVGRCKRYGAVCAAAALQRSMHACKGGAAAHRTTPDGRRCARHLPVTAHPSRLARRGFALSYGSARCTYWTCAEVVRKSRPYCVFRVACLCAMITHRLCLFWWHTLCCG